MTDGHHVIYMHGFLSSPDSTKARFFARQLSRHGLSLHMPDLNGNDFFHLTIGGQLEVIRNLANHLAGDLVLIGSSLGGYLACLFAQQEPRVRRLVLMAPAFDFYQRQLRRLGKEGLERWKNRGYVELFHYSRQTPCKLSFAFMEDAARYANQPFRRHLPTLIFHGLQDQEVPYQASLEYLKTHPEARVVLFNDGHRLLNCLGPIWSFTAAFLDLPGLSPAVG